MNTIARMYQSQGGPTTVHLSRSHIPAIRSSPLETSISRMVTPAPWWFLTLQLSYHDSYQDNYQDNLPIPTIPKHTYNILQS
jgi:hypothetical protein